MKLNITQADIDGASKCCAFSCPIARALNRVDPSGKWGVDYTSADYWPAKGGLSVRAKTLRLSDDAKKVASDFDMGRPVVPCTVELTPANL